MFSIYRRPVALGPVVHHRQAPVYQLLPQASCNSLDSASARSQRKPGIPAGYYRVYGGNSASSSGQHPQSSANLPVGSTARAGVTRPALTNWDSLRLRYLRKGPNNSSNDFAKQKNGVAAVSPTNCLFRQQIFLYMNCTRNFRCNWD